MKCYKTYASKKPHIDGYQGQQEVAKIFFFKLLKSFFRNFNLIAAGTTVPHILWYICEVITIIITSHIMIYGRPTNMNYMIQTTKFRNNCTIYGIYQLVSKICLR